VSGEIAWLPLPSFSVPALDAQSGQGLALGEGSLQHRGERLSNTGKGRGRVLALTADLKIAALLRLRRPTLELLTVP
jgi:hypothetical protein